MLAIAVIFYLVSSYYQVYMHEIVHQTIFENYNIESKIHFNIFNKEFFRGTVATTTPTNLSDYEKCDDYCRMTHGITESIGYQLESIILSMWLIVIFWLGYKYFIEEKDFKEEYDFS